MMTSEKQQPSEDKTIQKKVFSSDQMLQQCENVKTDKIS